jgi:hypothetical protein
MGVGLLRPGSPVAVDWRAAGAVLASIGVFGVTTIWFGLVPAVIASTVVAQYADNRLGLRRALLLGTGLALGSAALFIWGLKLPLPAASWPF